MPDEAPVPNPEGLHAWMERIEMQLKGIAKGNYMAAAAARCSREIDIPTDYQEAIATVHVEMDELRNLHAATDRSVVEEKWNAMDRLAEEIVDIKRVLSDIQMDLHQVHERQARLRSQLGEAAPEGEEA